MRQDMLMNQRLAWSYITHLALNKPVIRSWTFYNFTKECLSQAETVAAILNSGWVSPDQFLKGDQPRTISSKFGSSWHSGSVVDVW